MSRARLLFGGLLLAAWMAPAAGEDAGLPLCEVRPLPEVTFNPGGDAAVRKAQLDEIENDLVGASAYSKFLLGTFYRLGDQHPAALTARDTNKARRLLAHAALGGRIEAMAASAELELASGEPMAGMVWAQVYAHYAHRQHPSQYRTYQADLINRAYKALPPGAATSDEVAELVAGFLATHGERIEKALASSESPFASAGKDCRPIHDVYPAVLDGSKRVQLQPQRGISGYTRAPSYSPGLALYWLRIAPSGAVAEAFVVDSLPGPAFGQALMPTVRSLRFNAVADDAPMRDVMLPMSLNDGSIAIKP